MADESRNVATRRAGAFDVGRVAAWHNTAVDYSDPYLLHAAFERRAQDHSEDVALVAGCNALTYGELNLRANQLASLLRNEGLASGTSADRP